MRKLAAIMFTDIVGYSAMMSKDEKVAMQCLEKNRELHNKALRRYNGEFIKEIGDGTLSIFHSSWDAVNCAVELQNALSETTGFQLRIGIHIGDIVVSEKDVFGDGVNIASRIQGICEPGGILISEMVHHDIRNKIGIQAECLGEKSLKNIDEPVKVYSISAECIKSLSEEQASDKKILSGTGNIWRKIHQASLARKLTLSVVAVIILAVVISGGYFIIKTKQGNSRSASEPERSITKGLATTWANSIAVLPFIDLSAEKDQEYFCDGMSEALINVLTHIPGLKVVARTSAFSFKGKEIDIREIGEKLNVKTILDGSVQKSGNQLRISAQLIDVNDGYHLWSQSYDRELKDVFSIQDEITSSIAAALKTRLIPGDKKLAESKQTKGTEAYELYLKGRFQWNKRTALGLQKSLDYFKQAIAIDSSYAMAYAGLASAYILLPEQAGLSVKDMYTKAESAALKALEFDPTLAEPHAVLGMIQYCFNFDHEGAETEFKRAIELNPANPTVHHWYCIYLRDMDRLDEALAEVKKAQELDPLSPVINQNVGITLMRMQSFDNALNQYQEILELDPDFTGAIAGIANIYEKQGKISEALSMYEKVRMIEHDFPFILGPLGGLYIKTGRKSDGLKILDELLAYSKQGYLFSSDIAFLYLNLGDKEKTFEWLEKAYDDRENLFVSMELSWWDSIQSDPRYIALLRKMGLE